MRIASRAAVAAVAIVGSGVAGGLTYAAVSSPVAAAPSAPAAPRAAAPQVVSTQAPTSAIQQRPHPRLHRMLSRLEHGELTFRTRTGDRTVDLQRGAVTAVSPSSLSVRSPDGYAATYAVTDRTRVRSRAGLTSISAVHVGDRVFVVSSGSKAMRVVILPVR